MGELIPPFDFQRVVLDVWREHGTSYGWIALMGFLVAFACGLVGNYLVLRRMALVGDAISHSVLPGIAIAFLISNQRGSLPMFLGALAAGVLATGVIEWIHRNSRIKQDAAIGIAFSSFFAIGVVLINLYAARVDLDQDCVLYGEIAFVTSELQPAVSIGGVFLGPLPVVRMGVIAVATVVLVLAFYKELLVSSFDPGLAQSLGINANAVHYGLMAWLSVVVVSAFESVGAILVIAMLVMPAATASLLSTRLPRIQVLTGVNAAVSSVLGLHLAVWLECSIAAAMVTMSSVLFGLAWVFSPTQGLLVQARRYLRPA